MTIQIKGMEVSGFLFDFLLGGVWGVWGRECVVCCVLCVCGDGVGFYSVSFSSLFSSSSLIHT